MAHALFLPLIELGKLKLKLIVRLGKFSLSHEETKLIDWSFPGRTEMENEEAEKQKEELEGSFKTTARQVDKGEKFHKEVRKAES